MQKTTMSFWLVQNFQICGKIAVAALYWGIVAALYWGIYE